MPQEVQTALTRLRHWLWSRLRPEEVKRRRQLLMRQMKEVQKTLRHVEQTLPEGAKRRLAANRTALVVAVDSWEVGQYRKVLTGEEPKQGLRGFVTPSTDLQGNPLKVLVLNGSGTSKSVRFAHLHELGHLVDEAPGYTPIHEMAGWQKVMQSEKQIIIDWAHSKDRPEELVADALAYCWWNPLAAQMRIPKTFRLLQMLGLVETPSPPESASPGS